MEYIAIIVFGFACLQCFIMLLNMLISTKIPKHILDKLIPITIAIPVRNEEATIAKTLDCILNQSYSNIEVLVYNDFSTDATQEILNGYAEKDTRIRIIETEELPEAWLGKNFACYTMAKFAQGEYILFLDADVSVNELIIQDSVAYAVNKNIGLVSIFPKQIMKTQGEKFVVPFMNYILLTLLPLFLVRFSKFSSLAAANGQFMLFNTALYKKMQPHMHVKACKVEDIAIAKYYKKNALKVSCNTGDSRISCRMYSNFSDAIIGFAKNAKSFFGNSVFIGFMFVCMQLFGWVLIFTYLPIIFLLIYICLQILIRIGVSLISKQSVLENILFAYIHIISLGLSLWKGVLFYINKNYKWKGRSIS